MEPKLNLKFVDVENVRVAFVQIAENARLAKIFHDLEVVPSRNKLASIEFALGKPPPPPPLLLLLKLKLR